MTLSTFHFECKNTEEVDRSGGGRRDEEEGTRKKEGDICIYFLIRNANSSDNYIA